MRLHAASERCERALGAPSSPGPLSFASALQRDEAEDFPHEALAALSQLQLQPLQLAARDGGAASFEELLALGWALGRRDLSLAVTFGMGIWSQLVWMAGSNTQRARLREVLLEGKAPCLALSERAHGADIGASDVHAVHESGHYLLHGEKWPIGRAGDSQVCLVLARTDDRAPAERAFSWLFVDKREADAAKFSALPKLHTLGLRSAELSGLAFRALPVPADAIVGQAGRGVELTLRLLQITRPMAASLALGPADTALRIAGTFAARRRLYGAPLDDIDEVRQQLSGAFADLLTAECVTLSTVRGMHLQPRELGATSVLTKMVVPALAERCVQAARVVLGARHFLREGEFAGVFQKAQRDLGAIALFDGSTPVCASALAAQLYGGRLVTRNGQASDLSARFTLAHDVPPFDHDAVQLLVSRGDEVCEQMESSAEQLSVVLSPSQQACLQAAVDAWAGRWRRLLAAVPALREQLGVASLKSPRALWLAGEYASLHAAASVVHCWRFNRARPDFIAGDAWGLTALWRSLEPTQCLETRVGTDTLHELYECLRARIDFQQRLGLVTNQVGDTTWAT